MRGKACPGKAIIFKTFGHHILEDGSHNIPSLFCISLHLCAHSFLGLLAALPVVGLHPRGYKAYTFPALRLMKEPRVNNRDISGLVDGSGNGTPLQYSCLENSMDGGAW